MTTRSPVATARSALLSAFFLIAPFAAITAHAEASVPARDPTWATAVDAQNNLYRVTPTLYRSQQVDASTLPELTKLGIRTVVNLRTSKEDQAILSNPAFHAVHVPMQTWDIEEEKVVAALRAIRQGEREGPVLVHCMHGSDRTGLVVAMYRMVYQGWSREQAVRELRDGGYGFHSIWINIPRFLDHVDLDHIRREVDGPSPANVAR